jgi:Transglycosylase SLT domain
VTVHSAQQVADYWLNAGGPQNKVVEWVAIANSESGWDDQVVSPDGAIGLWQIMPFNAHLAGGTVADLYDPVYNARVTVFMSSSGANCAAWDSCFPTPPFFGRPSYLVYPEQGSPAWYEIDRVQALLGSNYGGGVSIGSEPTLADGLQQAIADVRVLADIALVNLTADVFGVVRAVNPIYTPGWRAWGL